MSIRHDPLAKRVNRVVSGYPAHKRVVFGFRVSSRLRNRVVFTLQKKKQILDGFKPSRNAKKPYGINSRRFFMDGLKPSRI
jgi:hypothetical protein